MQDIDPWFLRSGGARKADYERDMEDRGQVTTNWPTLGRDGVSMTTVTL